MSAALQSPLAELIAQLDKAAAPAPAAADGAAAPAPPVLSDAPRVLDLLRAILLIERVTADELRVTKAGLLVARLGKSPNAEVAALAKQIVARWKSQVLPPSQPTGVEQAKAAAHAAATKAAVDARQATAAAAAATAAPAAADKPKDDADDSDDSSAKKKKRKADKEAAREKEDKERGKKKKSSDSSPSASPTPAQSSARSTSAASGSLAAQHPELAKGTYALFQTDDMQRDKMQFILWQAIGEPPASVVEQMAQQESQAQGQDLSQYKTRAEPSPSPPPIADVNISTPVPADNTAAEAKEGAAATASTAASPPPVTAPSASASPSPAAPPVFRTRQQLALQIEQAMFNMGKGSLYWPSGTWYKQKYRDLAPQLKDPKNEDLNVSLFLGKISPDELVTLSNAALAPAAMKEKRAKEAAWSREAARCDIGMDAAATDIFQCDVCKERRCTYFQMQTRGADEPMTIFVTCLNCGNKFRSGDGER